MAQFAAAELACSDAGTAPAALLDRRLRTAAFGVGAAEPAAAASVSTVSRSPARTVLRGDRSTVDFDGSVPGTNGRRNARRGANPARKGQRCYSPLIATVVQTCQALDVLYRRRDVATPPGPGVHRRHAGPPPQCAAIDAAGGARRNFAQGNIDRHKSITVASSEYSLFLNSARSCGNYSPISRH